MSAFPDINDLDIDAQLDASGLLCPMPLLKAKLALNSMNSGQCLQVLATDPGSQRDFEVFAQQSGHRLLYSGRHADRYCYVLQKKA